MWCLGSVAMTLLFTKERVTVGGRLTCPMQLFFIFLILFLILFRIWFMLINVLRKMVNEVRNGINIINCFRIDKTLHTFFLKKKKKESLFFSWE